MNGNYQLATSELMKYSAMAVVVLVVLATGIMTALAAANREVLRVEDHTRDSVVITELSAQVEFLEDAMAEVLQATVELLEREPEVRTIVRTVIDTLEVPVIVKEPEVQIVTVIDSFPMVRVDSFPVLQPPTIIRIPADPRTFWSSDTYGASIGNSVWAVGGGILGWILKGALNNNAQACVVINSEQRCVFQ